MSPRRHPPTVTAPTFWQTLPRALEIALVRSVVVSLAYVAVMLLWVGVAPAVFYDAARLALTLFVTIFVVAATFLQRTWQDRAFRMVGLLATFFGLGMLLLFVVQLGSDVRLYFEVMPRLIEQRNEALQAEVRRAEQIFKEEMAKVHREWEVDRAGAATAQQKQEIDDFYKKEVVPNKEKDLRATAADAKVAAERGERHDTSAGALLRDFVLGGPSSEPQDVGMLPALLGSLWVAFITILFAVPVGVGAALYLEEYRSRGWLGSIIQVNINNLAGVPSVVYGILGGFVFVELIFKPLAHWHPAIAARNVLGGGLTLGLLTLPVVIVSAQEAIRAVPLSVRQAAYALGATRWQVTWHQVLPMAQPGILTGTILALSRAIGEAAPLVLFGALQFVDQQPTPLSRFTVLPMQIFGWSERPPVVVPGYAAPVNVGHSIAALASVLLLVVLLSLNAVAIYLRNRAQQQTRV